MIFSRTVVGPPRSDFPLASRLLFLGLFIALFSLVMGSVYQGERARFGRDIAALQAGPEAAARPAADGDKVHVWMVMVDSWARRLMGSGSMPFVDSLLPDSVYGRAEACADTLSVPCIKAIYSGLDRFSVFFLFRDVMTSRQKAGGTILEALHARGYTIGIAANHSWKQFRHAYSHAVLHEMGEIPSDSVVVQEAVGIFKTHEPDIMMTAVIDMDRAAHKHKPGSKEYLEAAQTTDHLVKTIHDLLPEGWHLMVFGDHGHDEAGRHVPGLDIPAAYLYHGPAFRHGLQRDIDVRTHYAILSGLFGVPPAGRAPGGDLEEMFSPGWIAPDFFRQAPEEEAANAPAKSLKGPGAALGVEIAFMLLFVVAGALLLRAAFPRLSLAAAAVPVGAAALYLYAQGLGYVQVREMVYQKWWGWDYVLVAAEFLVCLLVSRAFRPTTAASLLVRACILVSLLGLFLHLSTVYNFGATRTLMHGTVLGLAALVIVHVRQRAAKRAAVLDHGFFLLIMALALCVINIDMAVVNMKFGYLYWSRTLFKVIHPAVVFGLASGLFCAVLFNRRREGIAATIVLSAAVMAAPWLPPLLFAFVLPLAAIPLFLEAAAPGLLPWKRYEWAVVLSLFYVFYFLEFSFAALAEWVVVVLAGICAIRAMAALRAAADPAGVLHGLLPVLAAVTALGLGLFTFWITFGMRVGGILLAPVLQWLPVDKMTSSWPLIMAAMVTFYVTPFAAFMAVYRRAFEDSEVLMARIWFLAGAGKILAVAVFLRGLELGEPGRFVLRDSYEELIVWVMVAVAGAFVFLTSRAGSFERAGSCVCAGKVYDGEAREARSWERDSTASARP